jgi:hypothetical protein
MENEKQASRAYNVAERTEMETSVAQKINFCYNDRMQDTQLTQDPQDQPKQKPSLVKQLIGAGAGAAIALVAYGAWNGASSLVTAWVGSPAVANEQTDMPTQEEIDDMVEKATAIIEDMKAHDATEPQVIDLSYGE